MENVILCDCEVNEIDNFKTGMECESGIALNVKNYTAIFPRSSKYANIKRYIIYFWVPFVILLRRKQYQYIFGWQQFYALIFCFYHSLLHLKKKNTVVALNYTYKKKNGLVGRIYKRFMARCLDENYLDYIHVPSDHYADLISNEFGFSRERIIVSRFGINDMFKLYDSTSKPSEIQSEYYLALGRSNRDFEFLIDAWENINEQLVVVSDTYQGESDNVNVLIKRDVSGNDQYPWIFHCKALIIPIADARICSGDTVLLKAMSFSKTVIVTTPSTLSEMYVKNRENGICVPKEKREFVSVIEKLTDSELNRIGWNARTFFLDNCSRESMGRKIMKALMNKEFSNNDR